MGVKRFTWCPEEEEDLRLCSEWLSVSLSPLVREVMADWRSDSVSMSLAALIMTR